MNSKHLEEYGFTIIFNLYTKIYDGGDLRRDVARTFYHFIM